jgi:hypothetical protein
MTDPEYRALCAELLAEIDAKAWGIRSLPLSDAIDRARAALAQPEPVAPTLAHEAYVAFVQICKGNSDDAGTYEADEELVRRALKRLDDLEQHHPTIAPIPVSERPWEREGFCDAHGTCWMWHPINFHYCLCRPDPSVHTHSLPADALPLPAAPGEGE